MRVTLKCNAGFRVYDGCTVVEIKKINAFWTLRKFNNFFVFSYDSFIKSDMSMMSRFCIARFDLV